MNRTSSSLLVGEEARPWLKCGWPTVRPRIIVYGFDRFGLILTEAHHEDIGSIVVLDQKTWNHIMDITVEALPDALWETGKNWFYVST